MLNIGRIAKNNQGKTALILCGLLSSYLVYKIYKLAKSDRNHSFNNVDQFLATLTYEQLNKIKNSELHNLMALSLDDPYILLENKNFINLLTEKQIQHLNRVIHNYNQLNKPGRLENKIDQKDEVKANKEGCAPTQTQEVTSGSSPKDKEEKKEMIIKPEIGVNSKEVGIDLNFDQLSKINGFSEDALNELKLIFEEIAKQGAPESTNLELYPRDLSKQNTENNLPSSEPIIDHQLATEDEVYAKENLIVQPDDQIEMKQKDIRDFSSIQDASIEAKLTDFDLAETNTANSINTVTSIE